MEQQSGAARRSRGEWRGELSARDFIEGLLACQRNSRRLLRDAVLLYEAGRFSSAVALALFAIEEAAKPPLLVLIYLAKHDKQDRKTLWQAFENHNSKNLVQWELLFAVKGFDSTAIANEATAATPATTAHFTTRLREEVLYVDCLQGAPRWSNPSATVDAGFCLTTLQTAFILNRRHWKRPSDVQQRIALAAGTEDRARERLAKQLAAWNASIKGIEQDQREQVEFDEWLQDMQARLRVPPRQPPGNAK